MVGWESAAPRGSRIRIESVPAFDARGMKHLYGRSDKFGRIAAFNMDIWRDRDGNLFARFWSRNWDVDGLSIAIHGIASDLRLFAFSSGQLSGLGAYETAGFPGETLFPSGGILVILCRWPTSSDSLTCTASLVSCPRPAFEASSVTPGRWSSPSSGAEKNAVRRLRASLLDLLRYPTSACPGSLVWRQAGLPRLLPAQGPVSAVRGREERTVGLAGRQPTVHQALRFLRRSRLCLDAHRLAHRGGLLLRQGG